MSAEPRHVGELLDRVLAGLGAPAGRRTVDAFTAWEDAVGAVIAANARPVALDGGTLIVAVDDPTWATELRYRKQQLIDRLAAVVGPGAVAAIEVRVRL